tara:strand:+ start:5699 stop:6877 length:1179 start_codon:yes stop_codon:yes gene_type:complete
MSFKTRTKRKSPCDTRVTLQSKHDLKVQQFSDKKKSLKKLNTTKSELIKELNKNNKKNSELDNCELELRLKIKDNIREIEAKIEQIESNKEEVDYLLDTGNMLFDYIDIKTNNGNKKNTYIKNENVKSVMEYFNSNTNSNSNIKQNNVCEKSKIYENYLLLIDEDYEKLNKNDNMNIENCSTCNIEKLLYISEGKYICPKCGTEEFVLIDSDKPSYKDPPREVSYFAYKRINHFNEWLAQFQAKESTDIPQEVYNDIIYELKKERIVDMKQITPLKLREILKKLKKNKYYEHVPHIINRLNGEAPPTISRETEEELRRMFKEIQVPFHKYCPKSRKNFLSYSYVLHKFVELLELDEFLPCFILLKSREKLHQQDQIWKQICQYLNWQFIPSV